MRTVIIVVLHTQTHTHTCERELNVSILYVLTRVLCVHSAVSHWRSSTPSWQRKWRRRKRARLQQMKLHPWTWGCTQWPFPLRPPHRPHLSEDLNHWDFTCRLQLIHERLEILQLCRIFFLFPSRFNFCRRVSSSSDGVLLFCFCFLHYCSDIQYFHMYLGCVCLWSVSVVQEPCK